MNAKDILQVFPVYLALGTNLSDRQANLQAAIRLLSPKVEVVAKSVIYQTPPCGYENQPDFLNQVLSTRTSLSPENLLALIKQIDTQIGRKPTFRYGPHSVDLDILFNGDLILKLPELRIPHPRMYERAFVLVTLNELDPNFEHPELKVKFQEL